MTRSFQRFAGWSAITAAAAGLTFTVAFSIVVREGERWAKWVSAVALAGGGLATPPVGITALALLVFGSIGLRTGVLDRTVASLAVLAAVLLAVLYVGRLTVLDPEANVIKGTALTSGLVVNSAFFLLFARSLLQGTPTGASAPA